MAVLVEVDDGQQKQNRCGDQAYLGQRMAEILVKMVACPGYLKRREALYLIKRRSMRIDLMELALEAGAEDVREEDDAIAGYYRCHVIMKMSRKSFDSRGTEIY